MGFNSAFKGLIFHLLVILPFVLYEIKKDALENAESSEEWLR